MNVLDTKAGAYMAVAIVGALLVMYLFSQAKKGAEAAAGAVGGALTGNNSLTSSQTDFSGESVDGYSGHGLFGTLGAGTNTILGGIPSSIGETAASGLSYVSEKVSQITLPENIFSAGSDGKAP